MIVYFEDGSIEGRTIGEKCFRIDAAMGYSRCMEKLQFINDCYPFNTKVYTNFLVAFSNRWCWDDEKKIPMIYVRDKDDEWRLIGDFTPRKLREGHNITNLYMSGEFRDV